MRSRILNVLWLLVLSLWPIYTAQATLTPSGPIVINGQNGTVITGLKITNPNGDCVRITNSTNITIKESEIGPCMGRGVYINGGSGHQLYDNYIHVEHLASGCCDTRDGILIVGGADSIEIQGNVIAYSETNIEVVGGGSTQISVIGNFLLNPRGPFPRGQHIQSWGTSGSFTTNLTVTNNYARSGSGYTYIDDTEDFFNFGYMTTITVQHNYLDGTGGALSPSGCGLLTDVAANSANFSGNTLKNTGQCGIGIGSGTNQVVDSNKVLNLNPVAGGGNTAIYVWNQYAPPCGPVQVSNNIADELKPDMTTHSGYWNGGGCGTVTLSNNTFNQAAYTLLYPMATTNPPPLIPPQPKNCVIASPYSTQTSKPACDGGDSPAPAAPTNLRVVEQP